MDFLTSVHAAVRNFIGDDDRPVVVFSAAWPFLREMRQNTPAAVERLLDTLVDAVGRRSLLMPTFTNGFVDGRCDLDSESSSTGVLSEAFRRRPGVRRTLSAFFSFAVTGPATDEVAHLKPEHAWGDDSLYGWMERRDVCFLMFGTHPTHCSYLHRAEWLCRDIIDYRFNKVFSGTVVREGVPIEMRETLYVRTLEPAVVNDFTGLTPHLERAGIRRSSINGVSIASYRAQAIIREVVPALRRDPLCVVVKPSREVNDTHV